MIQVNSSADYETTASADSVSVAAIQQIKGKQFVKTAEVDMEVKDVYCATISIEIGYFDSYYN